MKLAEHEIQSALWLKLSEEINTQIETLRRRNDGEFDLIETTKIRGRIAALKGILALAEPTPVQMVENLDP